MANEPIGFLCYNNKDIVRDGYIWPILTREHDPGAISEQRLKSPEPGVSYTIIKDDTTKQVTKILERRKQLPANKLKLEILFSKLLKNALTNPITPGFLAGFGGIGGGAIWNVGQGLMPLGQGGIISGTTELTYHICDAETKINVPIKVTDAIIESGILDFDGYVLSVFGVVKEHMGQVEEDIEGQTFTKSVKYGINFSQNDLDKLGQYSAGQFEGTPRRDIRGATDDDGLFGGRYIAEVKIEDLLFEDQEQLFIEIIKDERKFKFRADNNEATGERSYPAEARFKNDVTNNQVRININSLVKDDIIYITYSIASKRKIRQSARHKGIVFQDNSFGLVSFTPQSEIGSEIDIFDYQIRDWMVPNEGDILTLSYYLEIVKGQDEDPQYTNLSGWRLSEASTDQVKYMWAADYRGILLVSDRKPGTSDITAGAGFVAVVLERDKIRDQDWFTKYLEDEKFEYTEDEDGKAVIKRNKIEDVIDMREETGYLFDISNVNNTFLYDRQKVHYYRPFALALRDVSQYQENNKDTGIGVINLDYALDIILRNNLAELWDFDKIEEAFASFFDIDSTDVELIEENMELFDLSNANFAYSKVRSSKNYSCEGDDVHPGENNYYWCHTYDPGEGPGVYFTIGYIVNQVLEWRPAGYSDSYWNFSTPYFCGDFNRRTRIYIEDIGGNSLNNYSLIYADSLPVSPDTISLDSNEFVDISFLTFREDNMHLGESYHKINDGFFEDARKYTEKDINLSHVKEPFDNDKYKYIGYSNILGSRPCYNYGIPVTNEMSAIFYKSIKDFFLALDLLNPDYGLDFNDDIPTVVLPVNTVLGDTLSVKEIDISYALREGVSLTDNDRFISLQFKEAEGVINDIIMPISDPGKQINFNIDCKYYKGGSIEFLGEIWKNIDIQSLVAMVAGDNLDEYKIDTGQSSVVFDRSGRVVIFYTDDETNNISVAISSNEGETWSRYKDILRLVEGEGASLPVVVKDYNSDALVHLFYVLNDSYIMYRPVDVDQFNPLDLFVDYVPPSSYDEQSDDDNDENPQSSLYKYTTDGRNLRRQESYFVAGDGEDDFFINQMNINEAIDQKNSDRDQGDIIQAKRFIYFGDISNMKNKFNGNAYAVYVDNGGIKRLFIVKDYALYIKSSPDFINWKYDVEGVQIHKNFFDETLNGGEIPEVKNIQVVKSNLSADTIFLLYFNDNMLFMRNFQSNILASSDETEVKNHLEVTKGSNNNPLFLVGKLSDEINSRLDDSELAITIPYPEDVVVKFDDNLAVDSDTQVFGYYTREGLIRVFYKDSFGKLEALWLNGYESSVLESWLKLEDEFI